MESILANKFILSKCRRYDSYTNPSKADVAEILAFQTLTWPLVQVSQVKKRKPFEPTLKLCSTSDIEGEAKIELN
jgi:hypothetical protein